ncbi:hypothetical protein IMSHALPRED_003185 [Imshaugia aleurites]|uniref:Kelch repeat protein n=1 Tax=Imshaugia aleurites TaxID=172621 RepID=A0A8H3J762_9LECA|nr:hypothetical protein IMSHALPRED_003185 [Imshaugia aleurites]
MGSFLLFTAALVSQYFLTAHASFLPRFLHSGPSPTNNVEPRQAPGVIAASEFLRRGYQASVVVGDWVYIDGGEFSFTNNGKPQFQYASTLLSIDLSHNWTNSTVAFQSTTKPDGAPNLNGPSLWYHESENLIYSGFAGWNSSFGNDLGLPPLSLRTFRPDGTGSGAWNEIIDAGSSVWSQLTRPGQPLMGFGASNAWVLGGFASEGVGPDSPENLIPGMTQFDMTSRSFDNSSVKCCNATGSIYKGALQHVPPFGPTGMFIAMGGRNGMTNNGGDAGLIDFGTVSVFDPTTQQWWNQTTTGSKPSPRVEFCTAGINSTSGTYEIFVYAGWGTNLGPVAVQYDTINILTLPAFHWISVPYNPENPRHGLSCNAVGGSQILTIGGVDSNALVDTGNIQDIIESTFDSSPDPFAQGLAIFDMTTLAFSDQYTAGAPPYEQSEVVKQFYSQSNGSYINNLTPQVSALLNVTHFTSSTSTNTSSTSSTTSSTPSGPQTSRLSASNGLKVGAVAGIAVGSSIAFFAIVTGIGYLFKRRRALKPSAMATTTPTNEYREIRPVFLNKSGWQEIDRAREVFELPAQSVQELQHPPPAVELRAYPHCVRNGIRS